MYFTIFLFLLLGSLYSIITRKNSSRLFLVFYALLTFMIIFRYGQGTDYFGYMSIYNEMESLVMPKGEFISYHSDMGFSFLMYLFIYVGASYDTFVIFFAGLTMVILFRFFSKYCNYSVLGLFVFYCCFFLIYPFSGMRQGLSMAIGLSFLYGYAIRKQYILFSIFLIIAYSIHASALILVVLPFVLHLKISKKIGLAIVFLFTLLILFRIDIIFILSKLPMFERLTYYIETEHSSNKYFAVILRLVCVLPVFFISDNIYKQNKYLSGVKNIMICSYAIYGLLSSGELIASRLSVYLRMFEVLFIVLLLHEKKLILLNKQLALVLVSIYSIVYIHNVNNLINQGEYAHCNVITYPYISVFDGSSELIKYRKKF